MATKTRCAASTKFALMGLLALVALFGVAAAFIPRVREGFWGGQRPFLAYEAFSDGTEKGDGVQLVHAKWCGHCTELLKAGGEWDKLKADLPGVRFSQLDEATLEGKAAIKEGDVRGFPDVRIVKGRETVRTYDGERSAPAMKAFVLAHVA